jgi:hypothetical protein
MKSKFLDETNKDFKEFMDSAEDAPPQDIKNKIFSLVHQDLNPNPWMIFTKVSFTHLLVGLLTLSICPQFGFKFFGEGLGLMKLFLRFGEYGCTILCGSFFVGTSLLIASQVLKVEELKVFMKHRLLQVTALTLISLGAFIMIDSDMIIGITIAWVVGSVLGGIIMLELGRFARPKIRNIFA